MSRWESRKGCGVGMASRPCRSQGTLAFSLTFIRSALETLEQNRDLEKTADCSENRRQDGCRRSTGGAGNTPAEPCCSDRRWEGGRGGGTRVRLSHWCLDSTYAASPTAQWGADWGLWGPAGLSLSPGLSFKLPKCPCFLIGETTCYECCEPLSTAAGTQ